MPAPRSERSLQSSIAAHESWANTADRSARTAPARAALLAKFEAEVDPEGTLPADERRRRADHKKRAYFQRLALKSAKARKARAMLAEAEAAAAELEALTCADPAGNSIVRSGLGGVA